jgi:hypothetical protein
LLGRKGTLRLFYFALQLAQCAEIGRASVLVKTVGDDGGGGFIDDTEDLEAGDSSSVFCCLALSVVEVWGGVSREILPICRIETSQAGTVTTACVTFFPRKASVVSFILPRTIAEITSGVWEEMSGNQET